MSPNRPPNDNKGPVKHPWKHHSQFYRNQGPERRADVRGPSEHWHSRPDSMFLLRHSRAGPPCIPQHATLLRAYTSLSPFAPSFSGSAKADLQGHRARTAAAGLRTRCAGATRTNGHPLPARRSRAFLRGRAEHPTTLAEGEPS